MINPVHFNLRCKLISLVRIVPRTRNGPSKLQCLRDKIGRVYVLQSEAAAMYRILSRRYPEGSHERTILGILSHSASAHAARLHRLVEKLGQTPYRPQLQRIIFLLRCVSVRVLPKRWALWALDIEGDERRRTAVLECVGEIPLGFHNINNLSKSRHSSPEASRTEESRQPIDSLTMKRVQEDAKYHCPKKPRKRCDR
jgi:hypothetical protein